MGSMDTRDAYKIEVALKYFKAKLTEYRSEERRKVRCTTIQKSTLLFDVAGSRTCTLYQLLFHDNSCHGTKDDEADACIR